MLKRQGAHLRPLPKRRCPAGRQKGTTPGAERGQLAPSVIAWLRATDFAKRETAALEHFARASYRPHHTCQVCQEAIRAQLQRRSLRARQAALEEDTQAPPKDQESDPTLDTTAFALADSSVCSPRSPSVSNTTPTSAVSPDAATLPAPRTYWADVGRAAWEKYWDLRSESASTTSRDSGRVPDEFLATAWAMSAKCDSPAGHRCARAHPHKHFVALC